MVKKKTNSQKDLFGKVVSEIEFERRTQEIYKKISPSEFDFDDEDDYDRWEELIEKYRKLGNKKKELECYKIYIREHDWERPPWTSLRMGVLLVDMGRLDEAFEFLDNLYGCESHDTIVASGQLQLARISAIRGKEEEVFFYLKEAFRTTIFFEPISSSFYTSQTLRDDIEKVKEFDKYRDTKEFQEILNFDWKRENEIELEIKVTDYLRKKKINPQYLDPIRLRLIEFLCKYAESEVYLTFDVEAMWLANPSKSIVIVKRDIMTFPSDWKGKFPYAKLNFSQESLESIESSYPDKKTNSFKDNKYSKENVDIVQKIIEGPSDVHIFENLLLFEPLSYSRSIGNKSYRMYTKRRDDNFDVMLFQQPLENVYELVAPNFTKNYMKLIGQLFKNYPVNPIETSKKENYDPSKHPDLDLIKEVIRTLCTKMLEEVEQKEDNQQKLNVISQYIHNYVSYLSNEEKLIFSRKINDIIVTIFTKASINQIHDLITLPDNKLYKVLNSTKAGSNQFVDWMNTYFELIKNEFDKHEGETALLDILMYFNIYTSRNTHLKKLLDSEIKRQVIKGDLYAVRKVLGHLQRIPKSERGEIFNNINLDQMYRILPLDIERMNQQGSSRTSKETLLLFELLYKFSKFNVQAAQRLLNKELIANFSKFKANSLEYLTKNKFLSFLSPVEVDKLSTAIDFKEIFSTLSFVKATQLLERLFKLGYKKARDSIKTQALNLALENNVKPNTKTFTKYVSETELKDFLVKKKDNS